MHDSAGTPSGCRLFGLTEAQTKDQADLAIALHHAFADDPSMVLIEPGLPSGRARPPDLVLVHRQLGVHVVEVKGVGIEQVLGVEPGFTVRIDYGDRVYSRNPIGQAMNAVFDIKGQMERTTLAEVRCLIKAWVIWPNITREQWCDKFAGVDTWPDDWFFADDLANGAWIDRLAASARTRMADRSLAWIPDDEWGAVHRCFGDNAVLTPRAEERPGRNIKETTLGWFCDQRAIGYMTLSDEQHGLVTQDWQTGPRLVRGVAGSGKSVVLASHLARRLKRMLTEEGNIFEGQRSKPSILAVCYNRTLAPFLRDRIEVAYRQRTGQPLPSGCVTVAHLNNVMYDLNHKGLVSYIRVDQMPEAERAKRYLQELREALETRPDDLRAAGYDAVYIDEGQDFLADDFVSMSLLCRQTIGGGEPSMFVFYDDAQNLYGRPRPNWSEIGLTMKGRSFVMTESFRNTRMIAEPAFNVLAGVVSKSENGAKKSFTDVTYLEQRGALVRRPSGTYQALFVKRCDGFPPRVHRVPTRSDEDRWLVRRVAELIDQQQVRPQDILVLTLRTARARELAQRLGESMTPPRVHLAIQEKDERIGAADRVTVSTVASAKGLDAYVVLLVSAGDFDGSPFGRFAFYVGCTRAREILEISTFGPSRLTDEFEAAFGETEQPTV